MKNYFFSVLLTIITLNLSAQVITQKTDLKFINGKIKLEEKINIDVVTMPSFNINKLIAEDERNRDSDLPFRYGYVFDVNYNMQNSGTWYEIEQGRIWSIKIVSLGAYSINLAYDKFYLPKNSQLYIYNEQKTVLQGPITSENNTIDGKYSTDLVEGSSIILEYFEPYKITEKPEISISKIVHAYRNLFPQSTRDYGDSDTCNINVICEKDWEMESNAVGMIIDNEGWLCSGCMINNTSQDFTPYFLTAKHCVTASTQDPSEWFFRFQYKSPTCEGEEDYIYSSFFRASLRASSELTDFALLELNIKPAPNTGIAYAGWSRSTTTPSSVVGIHHPKGDVMKISIDSEQPIKWSNYHWLVDDWDLGTTEWGSSGSPLFDPNHRIIGQVKEADALLPACDPEKGTIYGRFDVSWSLGLSTYLDPNNTGATTTNTIKIPDPYITGSSFVCAPEDYVFTLHDYPPNPTIIWTKSSNLTQVSGNTGTTYTVKASSSSSTGSGWVKANVNGTILTKSLWVGKPDFIIDGDEEVGIREPGVASLEYDEFQGITNVDWTRSGSIATVTGGLVVAHFRAGSQAGYGSVYANATNYCGSKEEMLLVEVIGGWYSIYPNPATDQLNIDILLDKLSEELKSKPVKILLFDKSMSIRKQIKSKDSQFTLNISDLKPDVYYLQIKIGDRVNSEKIIITRD